MKENYKPRDYNCVSPYFVTDDAERLTELVIAIFNGDKLRYYFDDDGRIFHAEIKINDSVLMFGNTPENSKPNQLLIHVYVPNVDETYQRAIELGCDGIEPPKSRENDPDKRGSFKDFAGNIWAIATSIQQ